VPAPLMFVGEQPGDKEDTAGKPFLGPAGRLLDRALAEAGIARDKAYITNAVKHFKFVRRGKIRLHQKPNSVEIKACRAWLEREREIVRPKLIVAMGATAARAIFAKALPVGKNRGRIAALDEDTRALVTIHPSFILRLDEVDKEREYTRFVDDLKLAAAFA
jgi:uracil-DNA glycosylase